MIIEEAPQDIEVCGSFPTSDFAIGDVAFIVDMFADKVYSNKERAVIRELSCNAHDSHIIAGTQHIPFRVHLPTMLEPFFSVRDYGTGLSDDEVRNIFAGIGISTKRNNNNLIGCFGIGSLSPYSLADSFMVKSYYNGKLRTYTCYRDERRKPVVAMLSEQDTDERNGLEVSLTVNNRSSEFKTEAVNVFKFWQGTMPELNDQEVVTECEIGKKSYDLIGDDFAVSSTSGSMHAVMGNIAYKIPFELDEFCCRGYINFNLGELEFDTARENLTMTPKVKSAIKEKSARIRAELLKIAVEKIESLDTPFKRAKMAHSFHIGVVGRLTRAKQFDEVMSKYDLPETSSMIEMYSPSYRSKITTTYSRTLPLQNNVQYFSYKKGMKKRASSYAKNNNVIVVLLKPEQIIESKIDVELVRDPESIPVVNTRRVQRGKVLTTYLFYGRMSRRSDSWTPATITNDGQERIYVKFNRFNVVDGSFGCSNSLYAIENTLEAFKSYYNIDIKVHGLTSSYINSKEFKSANWIHLDDYIRREISNSPPSSGVYSYEKGKFNKIEKINEVIAHSDVENIIKLGKKVSVDDSHHIYRLANVFGITIKKDTSLNEIISEFFKKYPMLNLVESYDINGNSEVISQYIGGTIRGNKN